MLHIVILKGRPCRIFAILANGHLNFAQIDFASKIFVNGSFIISVFIIYTNTISI
jgi:hypothetical protein